QRWRHVLFIDLRNLREELRGVPVSRTGLAVPQPVTAVDVELLVLAAERTSAIAFIPAFTGKVDAVSDKGTEMFFFGHRDSTFHSTCVEEFGGRSRESG